MSLWSSDVTRAAEMLIPLLPGSRVCSFIVSSPVFCVGYSGDCSGHNVLEVWQCVLSPLRVFHCVSHHISFLYIASTKFSKIFQSNQSLIITVPGNRGHHLCQEVLSVLCSSHFFHLCASNVTVINIVELWLGIISAWKVRGFYCSGSLEGL